MSWRVSKPWKHQHTSGGGGGSSPTPAAPAKPPVPLFSNWITENGWQNLVFDPENHRKTDAYKDIPRLRVYGDIYWVYPGTFSVDQIVFMEQMYPGYFYRSRRAESGFIFKVFGRLDNAENIVLKRAAFGAGMLEHIYHSQWQSDGFTYYFYRVKEPVTYRDSSLNTSSSLDRTELITNGRTMVLKTPGTKFYGSNQMPNDEYRRVMDRYQHRLAGADNGRWVNDGAHIQGLVAVSPVPEIDSNDPTTKWFIPKRNNPNPLLDAESRQLLSTIRQGVDTDSSAPDILGVITVNGGSGTADLHGFALFIKKGSTLARFMGTLVDYNFSIGFSRATYTGTSDVVEERRKQPYHTRLTNQYRDLSDKYDIYPLTIGWYPNEWYFFLSRRPSWGKSDYGKHQLNISAELQLGGKESISINIPVQVRKLEW